MRSRVSFPEAGLLLPNGRFVPLSMVHVACDPKIREETERELAPYLTDEAIARAKFEKEPPPDPDLQREGLIHERISNSRTNYPG